MFKTRSSCENKLIQFKQSPNEEEKGDLGIKFFFPKIINYKQIMKMIMNN